MAPTVAEFGSEVYGGAMSSLPEETIDQRGKAPSLQISARQFELYGLSLERGPNFSTRPIYDAYRTPSRDAAGAILVHPRTCAGEIECRSFWETLVLASITHLWSTKPE